MARKRVVITGLGAISPLGLTVKELWDGLLAGKSGVGRVTHFNPDKFPTQIAAEVKGFDPLDYFSRKEIRYLDPYQQFALAAAQEALEDSGILPNNFDPERTGVFISSSIGGINSIVDQYKVFVSGGSGKVSPYLMPRMVANMASGFVAIKYGFKGPNLAPISACAGGAHSVGEGFRSIQLDESDLIVAGGAEATTIAYAFSGFCTVKAMSTRNDKPEKASRPFDRDRDGFVLAEGAGLLVLEELNHALSRGAKIYAEIIGYGRSMDAYHMIAPDPSGDGAALAIKMAIRDANIQPKIIDYINTHGTGTPLGDIAEVLAIKKVFGEHAYKLTANASKSEIGHLLGGAGGIEALITALSVKEDIIHPTINLDNPDPQCDLDFSANKITKKEINYAMTNSLGFGGHNASLIFKKYRAN